MNHLRVQVAHHGPLEAKVADEEGTRGDVEDSAGEGFVEGGIGVTEASEAGAWAESSGEGGAEGEKGIFGCMMVVDCQVHQLVLSRLRRLTYWQDHLYT